MASKRGERRPSNTSIFGEEAFASEKLDGESAANVDVDEGEHEGRFSVNPLQSFQYHTYGWQKDHDELAVKVELTPKLRYRKTRTFRRTERRNSWLAVGGGEDSNVELVRVSNDDLQEAALRGDVALVRRLAAAGASVNAPLRPENTDDFMTLLHVMAAKQNLPHGPLMISELLRMQANVDAQSTFGLTPLACACLGKNVPAVKILMDAEAIATPVDDFGRNAVRCAATVEGGSQRLQQLSVEIVRLLCDAGVDLNNGGEMSPIVDAVIHHREIVVEGLLACGVKPAGLHNAAETAPLSLIQTLVRAEVNPFTKDANGKTVMDIALARGNVEILTALRDYIGDLQRQGHPHLSTLQEDLQTGNKSISESDEVQSDRNEDPSQENTVVALFLKRFRKFQATMRKLNRTSWFQTLTFSALMAALFLPDLSKALMIPSDLAIDIFLFAIMLVFMAEMTIQLLGMWRSYAFTFFFWMDFVGMLSVPLDMSMLAGLLPEAATDNALVMRTARVAKLGARAGRLTRLVKLLRYLPGMKGQGDPAEVNTAKVITGKLNYALATRVSCLIILMVILLPLFDILRYPEKDLSMNTWVTLIQTTVTSHSTDVDDLITDFKAFYTERNYFPVLLSYTLPSGEVREVELSQEKPAKESNSRHVGLAGGEAYAVFNFEGPNQISAACNCGLILCIIFLMLCASLVMSNTVSVIVVSPLESLLANVKKIASKIFATVRETGNKKPGAGGAAGAEGDDESEDADPEEGDAMASETQLFETVLIKIRTLSEIHARKTPFDEKDGDISNSGASQMLHTFYQTDSMVFDDDEGSDLQRQHSSAVDNALVEKISTYLSTADVPWVDFEDWDLDVLDLSEAQQCAVALAAFSLQWCYDPDDSFGDSDWKTVVGGLINAMKDGYMEDNPFHNFSHAVDVCVLMNNYLQIVVAGTWLLHHERKALIVASLAHDLGHPGRSNSLLVERKDELAIRYNDFSPLENMHSAKLFEILKNEEVNILGTTKATRAKEMRMLMIEAILYTDFSKHFEIVKELQTLNDVSRDLLEVAAEMYLTADSWPPKEATELFKSADVKKQLRRSILHYCDVGFATKNFEVSQRWSKLWHEELMLQHEEEKELGLEPGPLALLSQADVAKAQISYIEFFVSPLVLATEVLMPPLSFCTDIVLRSVQEWTEQLNGSGGGSEPAFSSGGRSRSSSPTRSARGRLSLFS
eukprot:TRINITY_DN120941_c0_g1_i1.p1 TRINITY_DN120941_c0_g1~~TRINITY_DN120941_c0_g1_i1.p1  ORF type:complete len:1209 (-),score=303.22 TRINITY_DN120941_c0_g1_i1:173-3799(-)